MCLASRIHLLSYSSITSCWGYLPPSERASVFGLSCSICRQRSCSYISLVLSLSSLHFSSVPFPDLHPTFFHRLSPVQKEIRTWRPSFHKQPSFLISFSQIPEFLHVSNISSLNNKSTSFSQIILNLLHLPISQPFSCLLITLDIDTNHLVATLFL